MAYVPFRNIGLKFLSICIATLLWLIVAGDRVVERSLRVPIDYQNLPQGLEIVGDPPDAVDVRLRSASGTLGRLAQGDMSAVIDLRNARPGRRLFHLTTAQVNVPYGVEVVQIAPATLPIAFENSAVRILQVKPSVEGRPAPGYEVVKVTSDPSTVEVVGPESALRGLDEAMTEPVSVSNETRPVRETVTVGVADPSIRLRTPQTATVTVQIAPGSSIRTITGVPLEARHLTAGLTARLIPSTVSVRLRGTEEATAALTSMSLSAQIDLTDLGPGEHVVSVRAQAEQGLTVEGVAPGAVRVRITKPPGSKGAS